MKRLLLTALTVCFTIVATAQNSNQPNAEAGTAKRILIKSPTINQLESIQASGMDLHCGAHFEGEDLRLDVDVREMNRIESLGIPYTVQIDDLTTFFANRARDTRAQAEAELRALKTKARNKTQERASSSVGTTTIDSFVQREECDEIDWVSQEFRLGGFNDPSVPFGSCLTVDETLIELDRMRALYPNLISVRLDASPTGEQTNGNTTGNASQQFDPQTTWYVRISDNPDMDETNEPESLITGMTHAREVNSLMNVIYYMWWILENYDTDPAVKNLVDHQEMYFVPIVNPDGVKWNEKIAPNGGGLQRKNLRPGTADTGVVNSSNDDRGVDLNRNFNYFWGYDNAGSSGTPAAQTYRGPSPGSEKETKILQDFVISREFKYAINHHSGLNSIVTSSYNGDLNVAPSGREEEYQKLMHDATRFNRYIHGSAPNTLTAANGDTNDWMLGGPAISYNPQGPLTSNPDTGSGENIITFSPENGDDFWPASTDIVPIAQRAVRMNLMTSLFAGKYARLHDFTTSDINSLTDQITYEVERLGQTASDFTLTFTPVSSNITSITPLPATALNGMSMLEQRQVSTQITLDPSIQPDDIIEYQVTLSNDSYIIYQTNYIKIYSPTVIYDGDGIANWSGDWSSTTDGYQGSTNAITSTVAPPYQNDELRYALLSNGGNPASLDLSVASSAIVQFNAKWDLERNFDFVQLEASVNNGTSWQALCGKYTKIPSEQQFNFHLNKTNTQQQHQSTHGTFIYDGDLIVNGQDKWVMEEFLIDTENNSFLFQENDVQFRFVFKTDTSNRTDGYNTNFEGYTFDNFKVLAYDKPIVCTGPVVSTFPAIENLDTVDLSASIFNQNTDDDSDWNRATAGTPSPDTGPSGPSSGASYYYVEASNPNGSPGSVGPFANAILTSDCIDFSQVLSPELSFDYFMFGANMGSLTIEVSTTNGGSWTQVDQISGQQQTNNTTAIWENRVVDLSAYIGEVIRIRFNALTGSDFQSDIAIDEINISATPDESCPITTNYNGTWDNGTPTSSSSAIVTSDLTLDATDLEACTLEVASGATLTINAGRYARIQGDITVGGTLIIEHEGSLVQVDDLANVTKNPGGIIEVRKTTLDMKPRDFMFMSSPMTAETRDGVYGNVLNNTTATIGQAFRVIYLIPNNYQSDPAVTGFAPYMGAESFLSVDNTFLGNHTASEAITPGEGLVIYPQNSYAAGGLTTTYDLSYTQGTLNNGEITFPIVYNGATIDNFNLIGNPYASAIDLEVLMNENPMINEVYFWEHVTTPNNSLPGYLGNNPSMQDFSMRNLTTGMAAVNKPGSTPSQYIASGQAFAIKADQSQSAITQVSFNNAMRVTGNNDQYRNNTQERDLIWLKIVDETYDLSSKTAIGFLPEATDGMDRGYDSKRLATPLSIYSTLKDGSQLGIQGMGVFDPSKVVKVGFSTAIEASQNYTISLEDIQGEVLVQAPMYLIDLYEEVYVNLRETSYTFESSIIQDGNRFLLIFEEKDVLGIEDNTTLEDHILIAPNPVRDLVTIESNVNSVITNLLILDSNGKQLRNSVMPSDTLKTIVDLSELATGVYFIQIQTLNGVVTKRILKI